MIVKHVTDPSVGAVSPELSIKVLTESKLVVDNYISFLQEIENYRDISEVNESADELLVTAMELIFESEISSILLYSGSACSKSVTMGAYLRDTLERVEYAQKYTREMYELGIFLSVDEIAALEEVIRAIIAGFVHFIRFEFQLYDSKEDLDNKLSLDQIREDECVFSYRSMYGYSIVDFVEELEVLNTKYKFKLLLFDEYPEYEEAFESIMGADIVYIDQSKLTLDSVLKVINGDIMPYDLLVDEYFSISKDGMDSEEGSSLLSKLGGFTGR